MPRPRAERPTFSLYRRNGVYYVVWWEDGRKCWVSCRTAIQAEANRFLAEFKAARELELAPAAPTLGAVLDGYAADRARKSHSRTLHYSILPLKRHLGDLPADMLGDRQVAAYGEARRREGCGGAPARHRQTPRPLADGTLLRELGVLRAALGWAVGKKWIATAPRVERLAAPPARERWLSRDEADRLLAACASPHLRLFASLALYTAARSGALLELTWPQVDLAAGRVALGRGSGNKRRTTVPVPAPLRAELEAAHAAAVCPFVVAFRGKRVRSVRAAFGRAAVSAGLGNVTPHTLRHTSATWMVQGGVPLAIVAKYLGNSERMVEKVYGHSSPDWLQAGAEALERRVS